jgi:hypothetical protein
MARLLRSDYVVLTQVTNHPLKQRKYGDAPAVRSAVISVVFNLIYLIRDGAG